MANMVVVVLLVLLLLLLLPSLLLVPAQCHHNHLLPTPVRHWMWSGCNKTVSLLLLLHLPLCLPPLASLGRYAR